VEAETPGNLGRYKIEGQIGRGMMGVVFKALDPALGRTIALKTVHLAFSIPEDQRAVFEQRFVSEARVAAALSHPGIVVVHDVGRDEATGTLFIALEYLEGETLADVAKARAPVDWQTALLLVAKIARALSHAHSQGVIHRDIKPANIMLLPSGEPKIMDFGIAKVPTSQLTATGEFFGTPSYMSPEQARGDRLDGRSDLFSLGAILYYLLTGRQAFTGDSVPAILLRLTTEDPPPPSSVVPGIPPAVDALVAKTLNKVAEKRFPSGAEMAREIDALLHQEPATLAAVAPPRGRGWRVLAIGAVGIVLSGAALWYGLTHRGAQRASPPSSHGSLAPAPPATEEASAAPAPGPLERLTAPLETPAHLELGFEHPFRTGRLKVFVDDGVAVDEPLEGHLVKKVLSVRIYKGILKKTVELPPGDHKVRVEVDADGSIQARYVQGKFKSGATRHLEITFGGLVKKELGLEWWS
jgi:serine/threonine-protein kinase